MRVIFLDIDGVLNSQSYYESDRYLRHFKDQPHDKTLDLDHYSKWQEKRDKMSEQERYDEDVSRAYYDIDPLSISNLFDLIDKTKASIVISSTWRNGKSIKFFNDVFKRRGFSLEGTVIGLTPKGCTHCCRGNEIQQWIKEHDISLGAPYYDFSDYLIIDDDSDMLYCQRNNFLLIDGGVGLTHTMSYRAIRMLNRWNMII
jgi:hypothetical protein